MILQVSIYITSKNNIFYTLSVLSHANSPTLSPKYILHMGHAAPGVPFIPPPSRALEIGRPFHGLFSCPTFPWLLVDE
jgi:hypothetical protein